MGSRRSSVWSLALVTALLTAGCYDFRLFGPEDAPEVHPPDVVSVTIEYEQPRGCINQSTPCAEAVVFFGSWMRAGDEILLQPDAHAFVWRGTARNVPVNYPPKSSAHLVRVFDPFLREGPGGGVTAQRIRVGGELLDRFDSEGGEKESAFVYVDASGSGHNPY